ncbi:hypothetical protein BD410DRAFT_902615 [Rickenella mellea]|uniref:Uncharacterized protein n=1 Tax=Rickenella mellea TaxID=50990 RepID=A0A4Y7PK21_9AGAM|nr:hypothetical protein BD410DRAFT_902615 [Rickenella mellea]
MCVAFREEAALAKQEASASAQLHEVLRRGRDVDDDNDNDNDNDERRRFRPDWDTLEPDSRSRQKRRPDRWTNWCSPASPTYFAVQRTTISCHSDIQEARQNMNPFGSTPPNPSPYPPGRFPIPQSEDPNTLRPNEPVNNWETNHAADMHGPVRHSVISIEPPTSPTMSVSGGLYADTLTTFPNVRGPNLGKLTKVYYRLLGKHSGPYRSLFAIHADDHSLSFIYAQHVPPPRIAENYISFICDREQIHRSRANMFISTHKAGAQVHEMEYSVVQSMEKYLLREGGRGLSEDDPFLISIDISSTLSRDAASQPLPLWVEAYRTTSTIITTGCRAVFSCLYTPPSRPHRGESGDDEEDLPASPSDV